MTPELIQDAAVTLFALGAAAVVLRRVVAFIQPSQKGANGCASCPSACAKPADTAGRPDGPVPLTLVRRHGR